MKDWLYIARRLPVVAWYAAIGLWRNAAPSILSSGAVISAFVLGTAHATGWWLLVSLIFAGFALGLSADRAEARGRNETGERFLRMLESDRTINVVVTKKDGVAR